MYKITKDGKPLDRKLYRIDKANQTFASSENDLVIDFTGESDWHFRISSNCTVTAGDDCFIDAYGGCTITAGDRCNIDTSNDCNITTGDYAVVVTCGNSTITGGENCVVIRRFTDDVIKLVERQTIKLNDHMTGGYTIVKPIETIEIEGQKYNKKEVEDFLKNLKQIN